MYCSILNKAVEGAGNPAYFKPAHLKEVSQVPIDKPSKEELRHWNEILSKEVPFKEERHASLRDTDGVKLPAQPVRNGGLFWRERIYTNDIKQERKKKQRRETICEACDKAFRGTVRSRFCSYKCKDRLRKRRARLVPPKLPILIEKNICQPASQTSTTTTTT